MKDLLKFRIKALALIAILLLSVVGGLSAKKIAIIDAGSSGSRLHVYDVERKDTRVEIGLLYPISPKEVDNSKGTALSEVAVNQKEVNDFMTEMTSKYAGDVREKIDLYILATAGMRKESNEIYKKMQIGGVYGCFTLVKAMTISGKYEGLYAWIAVNCKNGKLGFNSLKPDMPLTYTGEPLGILEIGGASMQIAFLSKDTHESTHISRRGTSYIYSKSYLGGGVDQVYKNNKSQKKSNFGVALDSSLKDIISGLSTKFVRLGRPINIAIDNAGTDSNIAIMTYAESIKTPDSDENFHPKMNAEYIAFIFKEWELDRKTIKAKVESDWTEGAAIDIVINGEQPEAFNYSNPN